MRSASVRLFAWLCLLASCASALAQTSAGFTHYRIAGPGSKDSTGATLAGTPDGLTAAKTDGTHVVFFTRTGGLNTSSICAGDSALYTAPIMGGTVTPLVNTSTQFEAAEPAGSVTPLICDSPILAGAHVVYGAAYTKASGAVRNGFFSIPLLGGASADVLANGDPVPNSLGTAGQVDTGLSSTPYGSLALVGGGFVVQAQVSTTNTNVTFSNAGLALGSNSASSASSACHLQIPPLGLFVTDVGTLYANSVPLNSGGSGTIYRSGILAAPNPAAVTCDSIVYDPAPNGVALALPGEPTQPAGYKLTIAGTGTPAVLGSTTYFAANQPLSDGTSFYAFYSSLNGVMTKILGSRDAIPGIPATLADCSGTTNYPYISDSVSANGHYVEFFAANSYQPNCSSTAITSYSGDYVYDTVAKTIQLVTPIGSSLPGGDTPYCILDCFAQGPGTLSPDGHMVFTNWDTVDSSGGPTTVTLYSVFLGQLKTAVSLTAPATSSYAGSVTLTAKVSPNTGGTASATGSAVFMDGTKILGTVAIDNTGTAAFTTNALTPSLHILTAVYSGDPLYMGAASAPTSLVVAQSKTTLTLAGPAVVATGSSVTYTAALATAAGGTPTGSIVFTDGTSTLATVALTSMNNATFTTATLAAGPHALLATYMGDANFLGSVSPTLAVSVGTPDFALSSSPTSLTVNAGQSAVFPLTLTPAFGFAQAVTLTCAGLPANSTCTFSPSNVTPAGAPVSSTLIITTDTKSASLELPSTPFSGQSTRLLALAGLLLLPFSSRTLRRRVGKATLLTLALLSVSLAGLAGCSSGSTSQSTPSAPTYVTPDGTSSIVITAASGSLTHTQTVSLTITN